jgi:hypothetical protein
MAVVTFQKGVPSYSVRFQSTDTSKAFENFCYKKAARKSARGGAVVEPFY